MTLKNIFKMLDKKYLIHRFLALLLSLVLSYFPIILNATSLEITKILENGDIIFSLIALLAICMFDVLEANLKNTTLVLGCFVVWFCIIIIGILIYIHQSKTPDTSYWKTNLLCLISSIIMYLLLYTTIALKKKEAHNND